MSRALITGMSDVGKSSVVHELVSRLYPLLEHIVMLTVPARVAVERLAHRVTNDYGKTTAELCRELELRPVVEPLLRQSACLEIDTSVHSLPAAVEIITNHGPQAA